MISCDLIKERGKIFVLAIGYVIKGKNQGRNRVNSVDSHFVNIRNCYSTILRSCVTKIQSVCFVQRVTQNKRTASGIECSGKIGRSWKKHSEKRNPQSGYPTERNTKSRCLMKPKGKHKRLSERKRDHNRL